MKNKSSIVIGWINAGKNSGLWGNNEKPVDDSKVGRTWRTLLSCGFQRQEKAFMRILVSGQQYIPFWFG